MWERLGPPLKTVVASARACGIKILLQIIMQSGFERGANDVNGAGLRKAGTAPDTLLLDWTA